MGLLILLGILVFFLGVGAIFSLLYAVGWAAVWGGTIILVLVVVVGVVMMVAYFLGRLVSPIQKSLDSVPDVRQTDDTMGKPTCASWDRVSIKSPR